MTTSERILNAAAVEFAERGLHGVRMEHVANRAKVNKALVYRHFENKEQLYVETIRAELEKRMTFLKSLPSTLEEILVAWSRRQADDTDFIRLIAQEGLQYRDGEPVEAQTRASYYAEQVGMLKKFQTKGLLRKDLDSESLFFALLLLTIGPVILPQVMQLAMPDEGRTERWETFLRRFAKALAPSGRKKT